MDKQNSMADIGRNTFLQADIMRQYELQQGRCIWDRCKQIHGKNPPPLYLYYDRDHIISLAVHGLLGLETDPNAPENLALMHFNCHRDKTVEDKQLFTLLNRNKTDKQMIGKAMACIRNHKDMAEARKCIRNVAGIRPYNRA